MSEYLEWQQVGSPVKVRIHRRVLAGLEREGSSDFKGIALGCVSEAAGEVLVEDFAPVSALREEEFARRGRHSLPAVGYFRAGSGGELQITQNDRELFAKYFREARDVLLLFDLRNGSARLSQVFVNSGVPLHEVGPAAAHSLPAPKRGALLRPREPVDPQPEAAAPRRTPRRFLWPVLALVTGVLLGMAAYVGMHWSNLRQDPVDSTTSTPPVSPAVPAPVSPAVPGPVSTAPPASTPAVPESPPPSPSPSPSDADRSLELPKPAGRQNQAEVQRQIRTVLTRWADSLLDDDIEAHVKLYAPSVSPYLKKNRASRAQIRDEVNRMMDRYDRLKSYKISDVTIASVDADHAIAHFRKRWETADRKYAGEEREEMKFVRNGADWQISSEQELKIYWLRKR